MTKKQEAINAMLMDTKEAITDYIEKYGDSVRWKRLYRCDAYWCKIGTTYILKSFQTIIAAFDVDSKECYDFLRYVYKYTATSNQHYWKFKKFVIEENSDVLTKDNYREWRYR